MDPPCSHLQAHSTALRLDYFCKNHASMGVHEIFIKAASCVPCAINTFNSISGAPSCEACPATTSSLAQSDAITDCVCNAGFTGPDGQVCSACAQNTFKPEKGDAVCSLCPLNTISEEESIAELDCICNLGYFQQTPDLLVCTACDTGKYKNIAGPSTCTVCGANANSLAASVDISDCLCNEGHGRLDNVCSECLPATYSMVSSSGFRECVACGANAGSTAGSSSSSDCLCNTGYTGKSGVCQACVAGKYKFSVGADACLDCPAYTHSPVASIPITSCLCNTGSAGPNGGACEICEAGTYKNQPGPAECLSCPSNSDSAQESVHITDCGCNAGFSGKDGSECSQCLPGTYRSPDSTSKIYSLCPSNSISPLASVSLWLAYVTLDTLELMVAAAQHA